MMLDSDKKQSTGQVGVRVVRVVAVSIKSFKPFQGSDSVVVTVKPVLSGHSK